jgi:ProP effector
MTATLTEHTSASDEASTSIDHIAAPLATHDAAVTELPSSDEASAQSAPAAGRFESARPVLETLFTHYPQLFGAQFLPLKLGIFQELLAKHPGVFERESLKTALGVHARSTRYLQAVAASQKRYGLDGQPCEDLAPEHIYFAIVEVYRRRQKRSPEDLSPKVRRQLVTAFEASGLERQDYLAKVQTKDDASNALIEQALTERDERIAKEAALLRAYDASGKTPDEFADMYGMRLRDVTAALARRKA